MMPKHKPSSGINKQSPDIVSVPSQFHVFWTCSRIPDTNNLYQTSTSLSEKVHNKIAVNGSKLVLENDGCNTFSVPPETSKVPVSFIAST
jgi:Zn-dependent oligopeptidase